MPILKVVKVHYPYDECISFFGAFLVWGVAHTTEDGGYLQWATPMGKKNLDLIQGLAAFYKNDFKGLKFYFIFSNK